MRFGIITPVFDGCLRSLELLFREIHHQTHRNWTWVLCSNGHSKKISQFIDEKNYILNKSRKDTTLGLPSLVYLHTEYEELHDAFSLLSNICKRRDYCIRNLDTDYVLLMDADAKIVDSKMFEIVSLQLEATPSEICIYKIKYSKKVELPIFPIHCGAIDTLNYCISTKLAKDVGYPTTINAEAYGNDFWFFNSCLNSVNGNFIFIDRVFGRYNGNNTYLNFQALIGGHHGKWARAILRSLKALIYRSLFNPFGL